MNKFLTEETLKKLGDTVTEIEQSTSAEIVIAIAKQSGSYKDISLIFGFICSILSLALIMMVPWIIHHMLVIPMVLLSFLTGYAICEKIDTLKMLLSSSHRKIIQVDRGAKVAFFEEHVSATKNRTGILLYISLLEKRVEILTDCSIDGKLSKSIWNNLAKELMISIKNNKEEMFLQNMKKWGDILNREFPPEKDDINEMPNRPRIR